jgi:ribosome maturation factor RimP
MMTKIAVTLRDRLAPLVNTMGYEFVGCEYHGQGRYSILRIYIDSEKGVTLEDCSKVSQQLSAVLDVEDPIHGHYSLEVSSPGLDRPLFEITHYQKQIGNRIKVRLFTPVQNQRKFVGVLLRVEENMIYLLVNEEEKRLSFFDIEKANVVADIG